MILKMEVKEKNLKNDSYCLSFRGEILCFEYTIDHKLLSKQIIFLISL
mgnify:FL=1